MKGVRGEHGTPGEFRRSQNWIGPPGCRLEDAAILREITGRARNRVYRADEVLAAIEEPLGQEGEPSPEEAQS